MIEAKRPYPSPGAASQPRRGTPAFAAIQSNTKTRMAEDRLLAEASGSERVASMRRKRAAVLIPSACAICARPFQKASSSETLVA